MTLSLFDDQQVEAPPTEDNWNPDNWETPNPVARAIASLIKPSDRLIVEPSAGSGNIAKYLPAGATCMEIDPVRYAKGKATHTHCHWINDDWLMPKLGIIDLIIGNPPFSLGMDFIEASARRLNKRNADARILFLLPTSFFQPQKHAVRLITSGLAITKQWQIVGRVDYERDGVVHRGRSRDDSIFELRLTGAPAVSLIDPYERLPNPDQLGLFADL